MLKVSSDGRKAALDMRLVDPALSQRGPTKISATADRPPPLRQRRTHWRALGRR
jgi:hypothetical protein